MHTLDQYFSYHHMVSTNQLLLNKVQSKVEQFSMLCLQYSRFCRVSAMWDTCTKRGNYNINILYIYILHDETDGSLLDCVGTNPCMIPEDAINILTSVENFKHSFSQQQIIPRCNGQHLFYQCMALHVLTPYVTCG